MSKTKRVAIIITVPRGDYCWKYDNSVPPCRYLSAGAGGMSSCSLAMYNHEETNGVKKSERCRNAREEKGE